MTREEWKSRAAARFQACGNITDVEAMQLACELFDVQSGRFDSSIDYNPEACVDLELSEMMISGLKRLVAEGRLNFGNNDNKLEHIFHDEMN